MDSKLKKFKNILLISGTGRNTGKTTFTCGLIQTLKDTSVVAVKISTHFHDQQGAVPFMEAPGKYQIFSEQDAATGKDSSRLLAAGAAKVFYIQAAKGLELEAFEEVLKLTRPGAPIVCESGGLRDYLTPQLHIVMRREKWEEGDKTICFQPDYFIEMNDGEFSIPPAGFYFSSGKWYAQERRPVAVALTMLPVH
jgi:hypothetical protein